VFSQAFVESPGKQDGLSHVRCEYDYIWDPRDIYLKIQLFKSLKSALSKKLFAFPILLKM